MKLIWFVLLAVSLLVNASIILSKKNKMDEVLIESSSQKLRWKDISDQTRRRLLRLDAEYYVTLRNETERWAKQLLLPKEAKSTGKTAAEYYRDNVTKKIRVSDDEVMRVFAASPKADEKPFSKAVEEIRKEIYERRRTDVERALLKDLMKKYGVQVRIRPPAGYKEPPIPTEYPAYLPPAAGDGVRNGQVVLPPSRGASSAKVVIEVFSDYMCPFSRRFEGSLKEVLRRYPDDVRVVFRHFPLPMHKGADHLAEASVCAQEQGQFWPFHDRLMAEDQKVDDEKLKKIATDAGLNVGSFQSCVESGRYRIRVTRDIAAGKKAGVQGTPGFLINGRAGFGALDADGLKPLIEWHLKPKDRYPGAQKTQAPAANAPRPEPVDPNKIYTFPGEWVAKGPASGPENAPVTIIEILDYNCPFCQRGFQNMTELLKRYSGRIRLISKHNPLPMHPNAKKAAEAVSCAFELGKGWEYRSELFGPSWGKQSIGDLKAAAATVGLKKDDFDACLDSGRMAPRVDEDMKIAASVGAAGTPSYFINGLYVRGAQPVENFTPIIDKLLSSPDQKKS